MKKNLYFDDKEDDRKVLHFEYIGNQNPIQLDFSNYGAEIENIVLEKFAYNPSTNPGVSFLGLAIDGISGHYNENMEQQPILLTLPYYFGGFNYQTQADDILETGVDLNMGTNVTLGLVDRSSSSSVDKTNLPFIKFTQNYLLNLTFVVKKLF